MLCCSIQRYLLCVLVYGCQWGNCLCLFCLFLDDSLRGLLCQGGSSYLPVLRSVGRSFGGGSGYWYDRSTNIPGGLFLDKYLVLLYNCELSVGWGLINAIDVFCCFDWLVV